MGPGLPPGAGAPTVSVSMTKKSVLSPELVIDNVCDVVVPGASIAEMDGGDTDITGGSAQSRPDLAKLVQES